MPNSHHEIFHTGAFEEKKQKHTSIRGFVSPSRQGPTPRPTPRGVSGRRINIHVSQSLGIWWPKLFLPRLCHDCHLTIDQAVPALPSCRPTNRGLETNLTNSNKSADRLYAASNLPAPLNFEARPVISIFPAFDHTRVQVQFSVRDFLLTLFVIALLLFLRGGGCSGRVWCVWSFLDRRLHTNAHPTLALVSNTDQAGTSIP